MLLACARCIKQAQSYVLYNTFISTNMVSQLEVINKIKVFINSKLQHTCFPSDSQPTAALQSHLREVL